MLEKLEASGLRGGAAIAVLGRARERLNDGLKVVHRRSWRSREELELATLRWVDWYNHQRLFGPIGYVPSAEAEANYYKQRECAELT